MTNCWSAAKSNTVYKYDPVGNLTNVVYDSGQTPAIVLNYDGLNRLTNMVDAAGTTAFGWTPGNQLASEDGPWADDKISYSYLHRLRAGLSLAQPNASAGAQSYVYDDMMRLTDLASPAGAFSFVYSGTWDRPYQITLPNVLGPNTVDIQNSYDGLARLTDTYVRKYPSIIFNRHQYGYNEGNLKGSVPHIYQGRGAESFQEGLSAVELSHAKAAEDRIPGSHLSRHESGESPRSSFSG